MKKDLNHLITSRILHRIGVAILAIFMIPGNLVAQQQLASRTNDFLNIIGVDGHIASNITDYLNAAGIAADTKYIGIRKYREALNATESWQIASLKALTKNGIQLIAIPPNSGNSTSSYNLVISELLQAAKTWNSLAPNALMAIEGPNEPINFPITYGGQQGGGPNGSFIPVANFQRDWYAAIKADPILKNIPVWSVTATGAQRENVGLQYLTVPGSSAAIFPAGTAYADGLNIHVYSVFDGSPTSVTSTNYFDLQLNNEFVSTYRNHYTGYTLEQAKALPKAITEFGYHTGGGPGPAVDLPTQAKNIATGLFNAFVQGYSVVCIYDLYDIGDGFGIFSKTGTPRTTATYLHNLTSIMDDSGLQAATFSPGILKFFLSGMPSTGIYQLFQKSDGHFQLVIWNNVANYNLVTQQAIPVAPVNVTVSLETTKADMKVFNPTIGVYAINQTTDATDITVSLADYPMIIDILPQSAVSASMLDKPVHPEIKIYPNPFTSSFTVVIPQQTEIRDATLRIFDRSGKEIKNIPIESHFTSIDRQNMKSGIYFYKIVNNKKAVYGKLIVRDKN